MSKRPLLFLAFFFTMLPFVEVKATSPFFSFQKAPDYGFLAWENRTKQTEDGLEVQAPTAKGGMGFSFTNKLDAVRENVPVLTVSSPPQSHNRRLLLQVFDQDKTQAVFTFELPKDEGLQNRALSEQKGFRLGGPEAVDKAGENGRLDLDKLTRIQLVGDWQNQPVSFTLHTLELHPDTAATQNLRRQVLAQERENKKREQQQRSAQQARKQQILKQGAPHPSDGATIEEISMAAPTQLHIKLLEYTWEKGGHHPFTPEPQHRVNPNGKQVLALEENQVVSVPKDRRITEKGSHLGLWLKSAGVLRKSDRIIGTPLDKEMLQEPQAYALFYSNDPQRKVYPVEVHRKSRPVGGPIQIEGKQIRHELFLELPAPLAEKEELRIVFQGLNTRQAEKRFRFSSLQNQTEALQVSQVGYRPDDPFKQASLSLWKGSGGAHSFDAFIGKSFSLVNQQGEVFPAGQIRKRMSLEEVQTSFRAKRNHAGTSLYAMDFSGFRRPGVYRIYVEGLGVSMPFPIKDDVWKDAFRISMKGFLHHRSGIALGPPFTDYRRPLSFHPDAGLIPLQTDVTRMEGESAVIHESLSRLHKTAAQVPEAWGGYMDAGDWDRRSQHLEPSFLHLELLELFPQIMGSLSLHLPASEQQNRLPDLLDEALWNIDCYARLQLPSGGVRGGIESTEHPRGGEASWQESLLVGVFAPDPVSSYLFTSTSLKAARLMKPIEPARARKLHQAGLAAWKWAEKQDVANWTDKQRKQHRRERTLAAIQAYAITGEALYLHAFRESSHLTNQQQPHDMIEDQHALFVAATLPDRPESREIRQQAKQALLRLADRAIHFQQGNAFNRATPVYGLPMMGYLGYFSVPEMISVILPRAHYLTGDPKYLQAAVATCNFPNGVNPNNMVYTTGVGHRFPQNPLHIDSRVSGQPVPSGITVYGQSDAQAKFAFNEWVHDWQLRDAFPPSREWPTAEAYFDIFLWPAQSEYTVQQTLGPTSYYWGYLASRPKIHP